MINGTNCYEPPITIRLPYPYNTIEKNNRKPASIIDIIYTFAV